MKAVQIIAPNHLKVIELEKPVIDQENNVLIKMKAAGICGSDIGIYHGTNAAATYPRIIGHEIVGVVEETDPEVKKLKVGDRVIIDQVTACGNCYACRKGRPNVCQNLQVRGVHLDGGYREYIAVPEIACYIIPDQLTFEDAIMIEPMTIAVQACSRAQIEFEDTVMILGVGALGRSVLQIAKLYSPRKIICVDVDNLKLKECLSKGATDVINSKTEDLVERAHELTDGYGPTVVIDSACVRGSLLSACQCADNAGRVITMGFGTETDYINQFVITSKELDVRGSRLQNRKFQTVIDMVNKGEINLKGSVSHTFKIEDAQEAFDFADSKDPSIRKIAFIFN